MSVLLSVSIVVLAFFCFLFFPEWYSILWININCLSTHLLMDIFVSSSWLLQIKLRWTLVHKSLCEHKLSFLLGNYPESRMARPNSSSVFNCLRICQTFPQSGCSTDTPTSGAGDFQGSTASPALGMVSLFHFRRSRYEMISHCGFCLHIPHWIEKMSLFLKGFL